MHSIDYIDRKVICPEGGNLYPMQFTKTHLPNGELFIFTHGCNYHHPPGICDNCCNQCCKIIKNAIENGDIVPDPIYTHLF